MNYLRLLTTLPGLFMATVSSAAVITNGAFVSQHGPGAGCGSWDLWAGPSGNQGGISLVRTLGSSGCTGDLYSTSRSLGLPHQWYRIGGGAEFGPAAVNFLSPIIIGEGGTRALFGQNVTVPWYVTFWVDVSLGNGGEAGPGPGDYFGWAALVVDNTGLRILSQGTDTSGRGIIVGTLTAVPEPVAPAVPLFAASLILRRRRAGAGESL